MPDHPGGDGRITVLWLIKGLGPGGAEQLLLHQARQADLGRFRILAAHLVPWKDHLAPGLEAAGVTVTCLDAPRPWDVRWLARLRRLIATENVDVVHAHSPYPAAGARLVCRSLTADRRPALVYTEHNRWPRHARATRWANRATIGLDRHDLAVSEDVRLSMGGRHRDRVEVLTHGVPVDELRQQLAHRDDVRRELGIADDEVVIGTVANFRREKSQDVLLRAAAEVVATHDSARFVSVGQGPLEDELRSLHGDLGLADRFLMLGYREDATRVMSAFDVFTLTSTHEGLPVALMDALALGLPSVCTDAGGISQAVEDGANGIVVAVGDREGLVDAYRTVLDDAGLRRAMGSVAAERAADFDSRRAVDRIEEIYEEVARGAGAASPSNEA